MTTPDEAKARELALTFAKNVLGCMPDCDKSQHCHEADVNDLAPLIASALRAARAEERAKALEDAAKIADEYAVGGANGVAVETARRIRSLSEVAS